MPAVLRLVTECGYDPSVVTSHTVPWSAAAEAFGANTTKLVITRAAE